MPKRSKIEEEEEEFEEEEEEEEEEEDEDNYEEEEEKVEGTTKKEPWLSPRTSKKKKAKKARLEFEEESESEESEDEGERAEARIQARMETKAQAQASTGVIEEISMENVMCHRKLSVKLCKRINFINGANGSGKSAILAALQICLGASAKATHRGNKLGDLVREGFDGTACVRVTLLNEGPDAVRSEMFGTRITVERKFSRNGKSELRLLGEDKTCVSRDRKVLREVLDSLKIAVENPVCVLDQENSKNFIRGKAKEKYEFFLKATEIQQVLDKIRRVHASAEQCLADAERQRGRLAHYAQAYQSARAEYDEVVQLSKYDEEIKNLKAALGWVSVARAEAARDKQRRQLELHQKVVADAHTTAGQALKDYEHKYNLGRTEDESSSENKPGSRLGSRPLRDATNGAEDQAGTTHPSRVCELERELSRLKTELDACRDSTNEATAKLADAKQKQASLRKESDAKGRALRNAERDRDAAKTTVAEIKHANASKLSQQQRGDSSVSQIERLEAVVAKAEDDARSLAESASNADKDAEDAVQKVRELNDVFSQEKDAAKRLSEIVKSESGRLRQLEAQKTSPIAAFGEWQPRLADALKREKDNFDRFPVGPIGAFLKLADPSLAEWVPALDVAVRNLGAWVVTTAKDRALLSETAKKIPGAEHVTVILQRQRPRYVIRDLVQERGVPQTVASVLTISDDLVFNAMVDAVGIDAVALCPDKESAESRCLQGSGRGGGYQLVKGVQRIFLRNGDETGARGGGLFYKRNAKDKARSSTLATALGACNAENAEAVAAEIRVHLERARQDEAVAQSQLANAKHGLDSAKSTLTAARKKADKLARDAQKAEDACTNARSKLDAKVLEHREATQNVELEDPAPAEAEVRACEDAVLEARNQVETAKAAEFAHKRDHLDPVAAVKERHEARNKELVAEEYSVGNELQELVALQDVDHREVLKLKKIAERHEAKLTEFRGALEQEESRVAATIDKARELATRVLADAYDGVSPVPLAAKYRSEAAVSTRIDQLQKHKDSALAAKGVSERDPAVAEQKMLRARAAYQEKDRGCKQIEQEGLDLKTDAKARWKRLERIRKHICRQSDAEFDSILQNKGASGELKFDHKERTLGLTFQKDNADATTRLDNVTSLSGGERSFTTLAMLLAIGATIDCPFRIMDEFDVFMDQVTRKLAMRELVEMAKLHEHRQFVFITPQDLSSLPQSDILKVFKLHAPIRGQQSLEAFVHRGGAGGGPPDASQAY